MTKKDKKNQTLEGEDLATIKQLLDSAENQIRRA